MMSKNTDVPYFSQWGSRYLTATILEKGLSAALSNDPNWRHAGAETKEEYIVWARHLCGMACLKMILAAKFDHTPAVLALTRRCVEYGGYTVNANTGEIKGLIYAPLVKLLSQDYGIASEIRTRLTGNNLARLFETAKFLIASVHYSIRNPETAPPSKGGHLVLVTHASKTSVQFHDPAGHGFESQENVELSIEEFDRFFAGRGIAILN